MPKTAPTPWDNQRRRTRHTLLEAATKLLNASETQEMDQVAVLAMVSRATAYRYFPTTEQQLVEAPVDNQVPTAEEISAGDASADALERLEKADSALHQVSFRNERQLRIMLAVSLARAGNTRFTITAGAAQPAHAHDRAALAPVRGNMPKRVYEQLCASLALILGTESMIVFRDVLRLDEPAARRVKSWAIRALEETALRDAAKEGGAPPATAMKPPRARRSARFP